MAKESNAGLGVGQRYGALLDTSEVRTNKTEGMINEVVLTVTPDLNGRTIETTLPIGAVVIADFVVDSSLSTPLAGPDAPYSVNISRTGKTDDVVSLKAEANLQTLINTMDGPADQSVPDVLGLSLVDSTLVSGVTTITIRYYNQRNI